MPTYKTPGVYLEEISKLPASVAPVETAIPAFIGYTETARQFVPNDLHMKPKKIGSLLDYELFFGAGPTMDVTSVSINENNALVGSELSQSYYLYDSVRLFYANGGGDCYITSIGLYEDGVNQLSDYTDALARLEKVDEPTLILFPDAINLGTDLYEAQKQALGHCAKMQDRFAVFDLRESDDGGTLDWETGYQEFRDNIGINDLKYGAAYTPHLISNLGIALNYRDIRGRVFRGGILVDLSDLTDDADVQTLLGDLDNIIDDNDRIANDVDGLAGGSESVRQEFQSLVDTYRQTENLTNYRNVLNYVYGFVPVIDGWIAGGSPLADAALTTDINNLLNDSLLASFESLVAFEKGADGAMTATFDQFTEFFTGGSDVVSAAIWADTFDPAGGPAANSAPFTGTTDAERRVNSLPTLLNLFEQVYVGFASIVSSGQTYEAERENALFDTHVVYRNLIGELRAGTSILPPSGAVVGAYAKVDSDRGVFKAPANVSLNGVIGLSHAIDHAEQEGLNVDVVSGKSINAIRAFTGKGILIWGARTLAGNDNEWRYVPVRRFFIFAEESIKKATAPFVFEPNDANTWAKVKSMIINFLTNQWRDGALQGAKPAHAFYVKIGLGETMTALDILEGRMIVEVGLAVVRPAEFIILRFTHKLPES